MPPRHRGGASTRVFADIDDTITTHGRVTAEAYAALERSAARPACTSCPSPGRPAGWCDHFARMWPVDAVVGENGAFMSCYDASAGKLRDALRACAKRARRQSRAHAAGGATASCAKCRAPRSRRDQPCRESDIAIDFCEDVAAAAAQRRSSASSRIMQAAGHDRQGQLDPRQRLVRRLRQARDGARLLCASCFGFDLEAERERCIFVGDSPNDVPMFGSSCRTPWAWRTSAIRASLRGAGDRRSCTPSPRRAPDFAGAGALPGCRALEARPARRRTNACMMRPYSGCQRQPHSGWNWKPHANSVGSCQRKASTSPHSACASATRPSPSRLMPCECSELTGKRAELRDALEFAAGHAVRRSAARRIARRAFRRALFPVRQHAAAPRSHWCRLRPARR